MRVDIKYIKSVDIVTLTPPSLSEQAREEMSSCPLAGLSYPPLQYTPIKHLNLLANGDQYQFASQVVEGNFNGSNSTTQHHLVRSLIQTLRLYINLDRLEL